MSGRNIRACDLVQLWARSAGMCSHPDCKERLVLDKSGGDEAAIIGQAAHIIARKDAGPRGGSGVEGGRVDGYENLILLCANHHAKVDRFENGHPVELLRTWKAEHEAWVEAATAIKPADVPWTAIVQEDTRRGDMVEATGALGPGHRVVDTLELRNDVTRDGWKAVASREYRATQVLLETTPAERRRYAVFSLGRIPLAVQLGYVLSDRARVRLFQYDRDRASWSWDEEAAQEGGDVSWSAAVTGEGAANEAAIRVSLSAEVPAAAGLRSGVDVEIRTARPSVRWLRRPEQLTELAEVYEAALSYIRGRGCERVHLYYAGPAPGAIQFGRAYNPRMNPPLELYEYRREGRPCYLRVITVNP